MDYVTIHISLSAIQRGFAPSFVNYKKGCTRLAVTSDKVYQLLAHGRWFSPASSTTKTGRYDISEILLKVALNTNNQIKSNFNKQCVDRGKIDTPNTQIHDCLLFCLHKGNSIKKSGWFNLVVWAN